MSWIRSQLHSGKPLVSYDKRYYLKNGMATRRYKRKYTPRKKRYFRKGYDRTGGFYGRYNRTPANKTLKPETKFLDFTTDDAVIAAAGTVAVPSVVLITQGTGESERIGRQVKLTAIGWRFEITIAAQTGAGAGQNEVVRVILFHDRQANGAAAPKGEIVADATDYQTFNNLANTKRFRTLMDRTYVLTPTSAAGDGAANDIAPYTIVDTFFKKCNMLIDYDATTNSITELSSNNVGILLLARTGIAAFTGVLRIRFLG